MDAACLWAYVFLLTLRYFRSWTFLLHSFFCYRAFFLPAHSYPHCCCRPPFLSFWFMYILQCIFGILVLITDLPFPHPMAFGMACTGTIPPSPSILFFSIGSLFVFLLWMDVVCVLCCVVLLWCVVLYCAFIAIFSFAFFLHLHMHTFGFCFDWTFWMDGWSFVFVA